MAKYSRIDLTPQMPRKFHPLVPIWSTFSEGLLRLYHWSHSWCVPSSAPPGNSMMWKVRKWWAWRQGLMTVVKHVGLTYIIWDLQAPTKPQDQSWAAVSETTWEREALSVLQQSRYRKERHEQNCSRTFWEREMPSGRCDLYLTRCLIRESPLSRFLILVACHGSKQISLEHFFSEYIKVLGWFILRLHINIWANQADAMWLVCISIFKMEK